MSERMALQRWVRAWLLLALVAGLGWLLLSGRAAAQDSRPRVLASFSILGDIAQQVAGDAALVETLIPVGANPHAYSPSARDVVRLSDADLVLVAGLNYEEGLLPVVEEAAGPRIIAVSECVLVRPITAGAAPDDHADEDAVARPALPDATSPCADHYTTITEVFQTDLSAPAGAVLGYAYQGVCGDVAHEENGEDERADEHAPGSCDAHVWTDPLNAALWALRIRDALSALDATSADAYAANAAAYLDELAALDREIEALLEAVPADRRTLITNHLALNYFTERYGLTLVGVVLPGGSTTSEPSVQQVLKLVDSVQAYGVPAIFTETTVSDDLARQIAGETGAALVPLYTGSLSPPDGPAATYIDYLRFNAQQIAAALR